MLRPACALAATLLASPALADPAAFAPFATLDTGRGPVDVSTHADGLVHPWALAFLPDGGALVTERPGPLRHVGPDGALSEPIEGVPEVDSRDQGGLLDVALDPDFGENRLVYLSYARPAGGGQNSTAVARGRLSDDGRRLEAVEEIFVQEPRLPETRHFGSRLVFDGEGHLYVALGERFTEEFRRMAQDLSTTLGKVVRIGHDGSLPDANPFVGREDALASIFSYGHRNPQAAAMNPDTGELWVIEHGPKGGDEVNVVRPGANYGWPLVSHGVNYDGTEVGTGEATMEGAVEPVLTWTPVIAPSGMVFYDGEMFPEWRGDILVGGLVARGIVRVRPDGGATEEVERIGTSLNRRIRDVAVGPDGAVFVLTDHEDGAILRLSATD